MNRWERLVAGTSTKAVAAAQDRRRANTINKDDDNLEVGEKNQE